MIVVFLFSACNSAQDGDSDIQKISFDNFEVFFNRHRLSIDNYDEIIVIPGLGCGGCKEKVERYFLDNKDLPGKLFIFTGIFDVKLLKRSVVGPYIDQKNVILDYENTLRMLGVATAYPAILEYRHDGFIYVIPFESPE